MGDFDPEQVQDQFPDIAPCISHTQPLGKPQPPNNPHAISVSLPTWESVYADMSGEDWAVSKRETTYPRFGIHPYVKLLNNAVLARLGQEVSINCGIFTSKDTARRCLSTLLEKELSEKSHIVSFFLPQFVSPELEEWGRFDAVLYHTSLQNEVAAFWMKFGEGISSRHAQFCLPLFPYMEYDSANVGCQKPTLTCDTMAMPIPEWTNSAIEAKYFIKSVLADSAKSESPNMKPVEPEDVLLYPTGMCAIGTVARELALMSDDPAAIIYGWPYGGTSPCVKASGYKHFTLYGQGTEDELDALESSLSSGAKVTALFCEITTNPQLLTPNLHRIKDLADNYHFIVICDNTIGTSVNVDVLAYVDVIITSLTKIFSGGCDVMGGSLIVNPNSKHYDTIHTCIGNNHRDLLFPGDAIKLAQNCSDYPDRVQRCNNNATTIANLIAAHPSVKYVMYPTMVPTHSLYERYRRKHGGYGYLLSVEFQKPSDAVSFYNALDVWKGPTIGTNSSIAIPYSVLAHWGEQDWAEAHGVPKYLVRLSVGLEPVDILTARVTDALQESERRVKKI